MNLLVRAARLLALLALLVVPAVLLPGTAGASAGAGNTGAPAAAPAADILRSAVTINGRDVETVRPSEPLVVEARTGLVVHVTATNTGATPVTVKTVRLDSHFVGLTFITYATRVDMLLQPGQTDEREFRLDLDDVGSQAYGLLPGRFALLDQDRAVLSDHAFPMEVRGSVTSIYGVFGLAVGGITLLLLVAAFVRLASGRLPANRWSRAMRFAIPGLGIGLTLSFTLSVLQWLVPSPTKSLSAVVVGGVVGFVLGYLTPSPDVDDDTLSEEERHALQPGGAEPAWSPFASVGAATAPPSAAESPFAADPYPPGGDELSAPGSIDGQPAPQSLGDRRVRPAGETADGEVPGADGYGPAVNGGAGTPDRTPALDDAPRPLMEGATPPSAPVPPAWSPEPTAPAPAVGPAGSPTLAVPMQTGAVPPQPVSSQPSETTVLPDRRQVLDLTEPPAPSDASADGSAADATADATVQVPAPGAGSGNAAR